MNDLGYIFDAMRRRDLGLAPHYLFLYGAVLGIEAKRVFEFGAGLSTRVILDALRETGGSLCSVSTESQDEVRRRCGISRADQPHWDHYHGESADAIYSGDWFDLVLHDGSHSAEVVEADLRAILPRVRRFGLILVHDTQHSYVGEEVRRAVRAIQEDHDVSGTTLPYGFGLTILRQESPLIPATVEITRRKVGSLHRTEPCRV